jgi:glycosyltransferase involved in cell wall biosynthesis
MNIHQFVPAYLPRDAVGNMVRTFHERLTSAGYRSEIYVEQAQPGAKVLGEIPENDWVIYHYAGYSKAGLRLVLRHRNVILCYHNLTPAHYFWPWSRETAIHLLRGQSQLRAMAPYVVGAMAISRFNAADLRRKGYNNVLVTGGFSQHEKLATVATTSELDKLKEDNEKRGNPIDWLFVGRIVPHKRPDLLIAGLAAFRNFTGQDAKLTLIGRPFNAKYLAFLRALADSAGVKHRIRFLTSGLPVSRLAAHYRAAQVLTFASEHEGFGLPLLEAMAMRIPVVAYRSSAVPETVGKAAVLLPMNDPINIVGGVNVAMAIHRKLIELGTEQSSQFDEDRVWENVSGALAQFGAIR